MREAVKLIIEVPKNYYESIKHDVEHNLTDYIPFKIIANGTPLDDVKAEIEDLDRYYDNDYFSTNNCPMYKCNEVLQILDNIGKAESEDKE